MNLNKTSRSIIILAFFSITLGIFVAPNDAQPHVQAASSLLEASHLTNTPFPTSQPEPRISLMFTGDINLGRCIAKASIIAKDYTYPFHYVAEKLRSADITIGSLDGTISNASPPMSCPDSMNLIGPQNMVQGLQFAGFDVITVATNHIKDCGERGYHCEDHAFLDTINNLSTAGIQPVGGGQDLNDSRKPVVIEKQGVRFAFVAIDEVDQRVWATENKPGAAPLSAETIEQIKADIISARKIADVVIVLPQWGIEYASQPEEAQKIWAQEFLDAGATLVVGNGPHIVQPMEVFPNGIAYYALGNFVFDQGQEFRRESVVAEVIFNGNHLESSQLLPVYINYFTYQPDWADGSEAKKIMERATPISQ